MAMTTTIMILITRSYPQHGGGGYN